MHSNNLKRTRAVLLAGKNDEVRNASITVFLSLTMLLIVALLGTMVEVTRGKVCRVYARRTLKMASDSLLTEYNRPLFDEYHLFFLEDAGKSFRQSIAEYASASMPDGQSTSLVREFDSYDGVLNEVSVGNKRYIGDDGGAALQEQITAYMKRSLASDVIQKALGKTKAFDNLEETAEDIDNQVKEEKEAAADCQSVLELMRLIDGVDCSGGRVKGQEYFVKMFHHGRKQADRFGITEPVVWDAIKGNIVELQVYFGKLQKNERMKKPFVERISAVEKKTKEALKITEGMKTSLSKWKVSGDVAGILTSNLNILEESQKLLKGDITGETISDLKRLWKNYNNSGIVFDYTGIGEKGGAESPMDTFAGAVSGGLAKLVLSKDKKVSEKSVKNPEHYLSLYKEQKEHSKQAGRQTQKSRVQTFAEDEEVNLKEGLAGMSSVGVSEFMMCEYMKKHFSSVLKTVGRGKRRLNYEWEYILCGGKSDKKNLETVIERIVLMRSVMNTTAILASAKMRKTAHTAAIAVVGFTGMEPLIRVTQTLFIILWGTAEALVDVAGMLQNKQVSLIKTAEDFSVDFPDLYRVSNSLIMEKVKKLPEASSHSFGYMEYMMLMLAGTGREKRCYRMMDLMEWRIQDNYFSQFQLGICVDSFQAEGEFEFGTKFFGIPIFQQMLGRKINEFHQGITINTGYSALQ